MVKDLGFDFDKVCATRIDTRHQINFVVAGFWCWEVGQWRAAKFIHQPRQCARKAGIIVRGDFILDVIIPFVLIVVILVRTTYQRAVENVALFGGYG